MAFLEPETYLGTWIEVRHTADSSSWIPYDVLGGDVDSYTPADVLQYTDALDEGDVEEIIVHRNAIGVRLSASGYMDATEWSVHDTIEAARTALADELDMGDGTSQDGEDVEERAREELPDDADRVRVEFYRQREGADWERDPIAVFPELEEHGGLVQSYMRIGQHGAASLALVHGAEYMRTDDGDEETRKLADELERIGYRFQRSRTVWIQRDEDDGGPEDGGETPAPDEGDPCDCGEPGCDSYTDEGETCPECERDLGADYTEGCDGCAEEQADKRATDLARELEEVRRELEEVRRELASALGARDDASAQLADARTADPAESDPGPAIEAEDRRDMLDERVRELERRAVELETALAELDAPEPLACPNGCHARDESGLPFLYPGSTFGAELGVLADEYGEPSNVYVDGTVGVLAEHAEECRTSDAFPVCAQCGQEAERARRTPPEDERTGAGVKLARLRPGTFATFTPDASEDAKGLKLRERSGARVRIVRALGFGDADLAETGPMFRIEFDDGADTDAFLDELEPLSDPPEDSIPFGAVGVPEDERLRRFALRALELAGVNERRRADALARGEDLPASMGDYLALAASRWGLLQRTLPEDAPDRYCRTMPDGECVSTDPRCMHAIEEDPETPPACYACDERPGTVLGYVQGEPHQWCPDCHAYEYGTGKPSGALTVRKAIAILQSAEITVGPDACLILSLTLSELEDADVNGMRVVEEDGSRYVEVRVQHPSLAPLDEEPDTRRPHEKNPERWEETEPGSDVYRYKGTPIPPRAPRAAETAPEDAGTPAVDAEEAARAERGRMRRVDRLSKLLPERRIPGDRRVDLELRERVDSGEDLTDEERERRRKLARGDWS